MAKQIFKYVVTPNCWVEMPRGSTVLTAQLQGKNICVWAEVDPSAPKMKRRFWTYGTGHDMSQKPDSVRYLSTVQLENGALVIHVYTDHFEYPLSMEFYE